VRRVWWVFPTAIAIAVSILNAVKPVVVDDTAYLFFARQIAKHPHDPYGFELFWYRHPQPAMEILAPPVVPYWLAVGVSLFGEHVFWLKLWLLPFAVVFCFATRSLLKRFARGTELSGLALIALSPAVLPLFNFMLDVPATALGLASIAIFVRGCERGTWWNVYTAGILAGVATQTKYTMVTVPAVLLLFGVLHRRLVPALIATSIGIAVFVLWEVWLIDKYGVSHFLFHVRDQQSVTSGISEWLDKKGSLANPLLGFLGGLACATGLYAGRGIGFGKRFVMVVAVCAALGMLAVCFVPYSQGVLLRSRVSGSPRLDLAAIVFYPLGASVLVTLAIAIWTLTFRATRGTLGRLRRTPATWFLIGWLGIELIAYFALTPFPAGRRVILICVVLGFIACRLVSRIQRIHPGRRPERWITYYAAGLGLGLYALDAWDALPERQFAYRANEIIGDRRGAQVWMQGHWGWQYYTDRLGMTLVDPGRTTLRAGDWFVAPRLPNEVGFFRPYHGEATFHLDLDAIEPVAELSWDDWIAGQTIPSLYGGVVPINGRDHPRLRIHVFRIVRDWTPDPR
jgi:hypothetical protein